MAAERSRGGDQPAAAPVKSADRTLAILEFAGGRGDFALSDLRRELNLAPSSAHGLLSTLVRRGWLEHDQPSRRFRLGLRAWSVGQAYRGATDILQVATPAMNALRDQLDETVQLAQLHDMDNVYLAISEARRPMRLASSVGARIPAHATGIGKALLAQLDPGDADRRIRGAELVRYTANTVVDHQALVDLVAAVRSRGWAVDDEEYLPGCCCVAVPIPTPTGRPPLAMSITVPISRRDADWPARPLALLRKAAGAVGEGIALLAPAG